MSNKHGANLFELSRVYGFEMSDIKDYSSNINPFGVSKEAIKALEENLDKASVYPDPEYKELKDSISRYTGCSGENVLLASGVSGFIKSLVKIFKPKVSLIYAPAYSEYERELSNNGSKIIKYNLTKEKDFEVDIKQLIHKINENEIDFVFLCNPNNPTGTILGSGDVEHILKNTKCILVIDETYIEFSNVKKFSSIHLTEKYEKLIVMRSTSKYFASPGIRLGYAISSNDFLHKIYSKKEELIWDINIYAQIMGIVMFGDSKYQNEVYKFIENQRNYIYDELKKIKSLKTYKSYGNFILIEIIDKSLTSRELYDKLLQDAMIIRNCENFENLDEFFFRICILSEEDNRKIIGKLKNIFN